ncbi:MAG: hypothetical protein WAU10_08895, partial [Caldilineaceae bacterium]
VPKLLQIFRALFDIHALLLAQFSFFVNYSLVSFVFPLSKVQWENCRQINERRDWVSAPPRLFLH